MENTEKERCCINCSHSYPIALPEENPAPWMPWMQGRRICEISQGIIIMDLYKKNSCYDFEETM